MAFVTKILVKLGILKEDLDYHFVRASMVIIFLFFGYQKWFDYEAQALIPYISNGPLISWMYPVFGIRGATYFLGVAEWLFGGLLFLGFWNKKLGILGALGSCFSFVSTITIIPFIPGGWAASAGGFPAMTETGTDIAIPNRMRCQRIGGQATNQQCRREMSKCPAQEGSTERHCPLTSSLARVSDGSCRDGFVYVRNLFLCDLITTSGFAHPTHYS